MSMSSTIPRLLDVFVLGEGDLSFDFSLNKNADMPLFSSCYVLSKAIFSSEKTVGEV